MENFLNGRITHTLLWTLIHSLWQGIITALIAALLITTTKKLTSIVRYRLLGCVLIGFLIISITTFCYEINLPLNDNTTVQLTIHNSGYYATHTLAGNQFNSISEAFYTYNSIKII